MKYTEYAIPEIKISYKPGMIATQKRRFSSTSEIYYMFMEIFDCSVMNIKEEAAVLFLNRANRVIGAYKLSSGGISSAVVDIRLILSIALKSLASGIILAHTHPSGDLVLSRFDLALTVKLQEAAS